MKVFVVVLTAPNSLTLRGRSDSYKYREPAVRLKARKHAYHTNFNITVNIILTHYGRQSHHSRRLDRKPGQHALHRPTQKRY